MPIIYTYPTVSPQSSDLITLSDEGSTGSPTKSATAKSIANLATSVTLASLTLVAAPPANAASIGTTGMIATDTDYIYVCTATNTWKRAAITTW